MHLHFKKWNKNISSWFAYIFIHTTLQLLYNLILRCNLHWVLQFAAPLKFFPRNKMFWSFKATFIGNIFKFFLQIFVKVTVLYQCMKEDIWWIKMMAHYMCAWCLTLSKSLTCVHCVKLWIVLWAINRTQPHYFIPIWIQICMCT